MASKMTPWEVEGNVDYGRIVKDFGTKLIDLKLLNKMKKPMPTIIRRGFYFSHRDLDKFLSAADSKKKISVVSGRGPSEKMHIGHLIPFIAAKYFQDAYGCKVYIPISDDEKYYVKNKLSIGDSERFGEDNILDIISVGFNPKKTVIHRDFQYTKIYKYAAQIAKHTTYSTVKAVFGLDPSHNIGWTFYPAMQSAHILLPQFLDEPQHTIVPIAIDQDPFMRVLRDVAEKEEFKFIKPAAIHSKFLPGLSGDDKMSASKGDDVIWLGDDEKAVHNKIMKYAFSGGRVSVAEHRKLGGNPDVDVSYRWLKMMFEPDDKKLKSIYDDYKSGKMLTGELKGILIEKINAFLKEHQKKREHARKAVDKFLMVD